MSEHIHVTSHDTKPEAIRVQHLEPIAMTFDETMDAAHRYKQEAEQSGLSEIEKWAKLDTARNLSQDGLTLLVKKYKGEK